MAKKIGKKSSFEIITHGLNDKEISELETSHFIVCLLKGAGVPLNEEDALNVVWDFVRGGLKKDSGQELGRLVASLAPGSMGLQ